MNSAIQAFASVAMCIVSTVAVAQDTQDDTPTIVALTPLGAQFQLNQGRIIGLTLTGDAIDDETLSLIAGLDRLQSLTLHDTKVTGEGLKSLQKLPLLGVLSIHNTPISDRDIDELAALKSVVNYDLRGTKVSGMGRQRLENLLRKAKREATVRLHFGGFLGVAGNYGEARCTLTNVIPDSAAAAAGLEVGDVITKFNGQPITQFTELVEATSLTPPEQPIPITIKRDGKSKELTVSLRRQASP